MAKGYCEKKNRECGGKCFCGYGYERQLTNLPCKHLVSENRGYSGYDSLKDIKGERMRRQWFFCLAIVVLLFLVYGLYLNLVMVGILDIERDTRQDLIDSWVIFYKVAIPLLLLSFLNLKFFGKIVAVVTKEGVYSNQFFLKWEDIFEVKFHLPALTKTRLYYSYTEIISSQGTYAVAHVPLLFLFKVKKYNVNTRIKIEKWWIVVVVISLVLPFALPFFE